MSPERKNELLEKTKKMHERIQTPADLGRLVQMGVENGGLDRIGQSRYYFDQNNDVYEITGTPNEKEKELGYSMHIRADYRSRNFVENELKNVAPYAHSLSNNINIDLKDAFAIIRNVDQEGRKQFTKDIIGLVKFAQEHPVEIALRGYSMDELNDTYILAKAQGKTKNAMAVEEVISRAAKVGLENGDLIKYMSSETQELSTEDINKRIDSVKESLSWLGNYSKGDYEAARNTLFQSLFPIEILKKQENDLSHVIEIDGLNVIAPFWKETTAELDEMVRAGQSYDENKVEELLLKNIIESQRLADQIMKDPKVIEQIENPKFMKSIEIGSNSKAHRALERLGKILKSYVPYNDMVKGPVRFGTSPALDYFKFRAKEYLRSPEFINKAEKMCEQNNVPKYLAPALGVYKENYDALNEILTSIPKKDLSVPENKAQDLLKSLNKVMHFEKAYDEYHFVKQSKIISDEEIRSVDSKEPYSVSNETAVKGYIIAEQLGVKGIETYEQASLLCQMYEGPLDGKSYPLKECLEIAKKLFEQEVPGPDEFKSYVKHNFPIEFPEIQEMFEQNNLESYVDTNYPMECQEEYPKEWPEEDGPELER